MTKELYYELREIEDRLYNITNEIREPLDGELSGVWASLYSYLEKIKVNYLE